MTGEEVGTRQDLDDQNSDDQTKMDDLDVLEILEKEARTGCPRFNEDELSILKIFRQNSLLREKAEDLLAANEKIKK
ncbi:hypothetical protein KKF38_03675 [Patescibacteria group bacterium]|nr:hypothetical protein [Patescibacteria group bacterium]